MNPYQVENCILLACYRLEPREWTGSIANLANQIRELGGLEPPEYKHIVDAITELRRSDQLRVRKWRENNDFESFDCAKWEDRAYVSNFFFTRDFRMELTQSGHKRLADLPMPQPPRQRIGF